MDAENWFTRSTRFILLLGGFVCGPILLDLVVFIQDNFVVDAMEVEASVIEWEEGGGCDNACDW